MMILFLILIGIAFYYLIADRSRPAQKSKDMDAIEVLKMRFANGEIDLETYQKTLKVLEE